MNRTMPLCDLPTGERAQVVALHHPTLRRRLMDIGLVPHAWVACVGRSPGGDPSAYEVCGAVIAIRCGDAAYVEIRTEERDGYGAD